MDHGAEIHAEQIRLAYQQAGPALIGTIVNALIVVAVLWRYVPRPFLLAWLVAIVLLVLGRRWLVGRYFLAGPSVAESAVWERWYVRGVALNGILWGMGGFVLFADRSYVHQLFLAFVLGGMAAGGVTTLSSLRGAYPAFLLPALVPYTVRLLVEGGDVHLAMAGMLVLFVSLMWMISRHLHETMRESLRLRFANLDLCDDLRRARDRQERVNRELALQVEARYRAQSALQEANVALDRRVRERTEQLAQSEQALREASRRKDEFLAMLGHELRNPLAPIRNAAKVMSKQGISDAMRTWARDVINRQIDHLAHLVDDLLDVSRIVQGKIRLDLVPVELSLVADRALETSQPLIDARQHQLAISLPEESVWVRGDTVRLAQVMSNLLNNAAKYTDPGGTIGLEIEPSETDVCITVRDNGVGIAPELLPHVFEIFTQAERSLARAQGGLGIGLTLVKRLTELHGGRVEVRSEGPGRGAEFRVFLPRWDDSMDAGSCTGTPGAQQLF